MPPDHAQSPPAARLQLTLALGASILAHAAVAAALVAGVASPADPPRRPTWQEPPAPPETPPDIRLGAERSDVTSITWIGADEYERHAMEEASAVDQPELTLDDPAGQPSRPVPPALTSAPSVEPGRPRPGTQLPETSVEPGRPRPETQPPEIVPERADLSRPPVITQPAADAPPEPLHVAQDEPRLADVVAPNPEEPAPQFVAPAPQPADAPVGPPAPAAMAVPPPRDPQELAPMPSPQPIDSTPSQAAPAGADGQGEKADRESAPSSTITAQVRDLGKPLVAHGLEIRTIRPRFTYYTQLTASPRSPLVRIQFNRKGVVHKAELVEASGVADVDRPLLDAIYQWRAKGKQLERLPAGNAPDTVTIEIRILL